MASSSWMSMRRTRHPMFAKNFTNGFDLVFVSANCTSEMQPLDISLNGPPKEECKEGFSVWYSQEVCDTITSSEEIEAETRFTQPDLRLSNIKPLHSRWTMDAFASVSSHPELVRHG